MKFSEKIVKLRKMKGLTQDEFASAVGVSRQAVYKWESGQSYPEVAKLLEMKMLFNISIDDLLDESYEVVVPEKPKRKKISKADKVKVEKKLEATPLEEAPKEEPAVVAAPVIEEAIPEVNEAVAPEAAPETVPTEEAPKEETRRGFFARLFGRK